MKRIIYRYLSGFAFGVMMLVLCFLLTYSFGEQTYYQRELAQVFSPRALLLQTVWAGILYVCITITLINTHEFLKQDNTDVTVQYLLMFTIHTLVIIFVSFLAQEYGDFGLGVYSLLFGIGMIILMFGTLADMIQNVMKMKKLNKKLFVVSAKSISTPKTATSKARTTSSAKTTKKSTTTSRTKSTASKTTKK